MDRWLNTLASVWSLFWHSSVYALNVDKVVCKMAEYAPSEVSNFVQKMAGGREMNT